MTSHFIRLGFLILLLPVLLLFGSCASTEPVNATTDGDMEKIEDGDTLVDGDSEESDADAEEETDIVDGDADEHPDGDVPIDGDMELEEESEEEIETPVDHNYPDEIATKNDYNKTEYLIITSADMLDAWQELANWKSQKGVPTRVISMDTILAESSGVDDAEALRNWLMAQGETLPLQYVLLAGDTPLVPHREFWAETDVFGLDYYDGTLASDLYFADWDGTWDDNENGIWAEADDGLDLVPEVSLTRLPVDNAAEAEDVIAKVLTYEQAPPSNYVEDVLFLSEDTGFYGIDSSYGLDSLSREEFPDSFSFTKLYNDPTEFPDASLNTHEAQVEAINAGPHFVVHFGHGGGRDVGYLDTDDMGSLSNDPRNTIYVSTACYSGGFHDEIQSGGDSYVVSPSGGGVAYFGNTNVGIGFPSGMDFIYEFFKVLFMKRAEFHNLGRVYDKARLDFTTDRQMHLDGHPDRWTVMGMVVFADPEMPIWTGEPKDFSAAYPSVLHPGKFRFQVVVTDNSKPISGARVAILTPNAQLYRAWTDESGFAEICFEPGDIAQAVLTITADGYRPLIDSLSIAAD
jgi:hypothetical protein